MPEADGVDREIFTLGYFTNNFYVFYACLACYLLSEVLGEVSSPAELTGIAGQDVIFQFNTTGKNAIKGTKFGLSDGNKDYPIPKFITVLLKNGVLEETCGEDLYGPAAARYKGRVTFVGDLKKGHAWFKISNLSVTDTNMYMCKISEDTDVGYKRTNRVKMTVLETEVTPPVHVSEAKYTDFKGVATKTCKSYRLLREENSLAVNVALRQAYWNMSINHQIKIKSIRKVNRTVTAWFHINFDKAINTSFAFSFLAMAQRNDRLRGYIITRFEKLDVKTDNPNGFNPRLIAFYVIIALVGVALVIFLVIWKLKPELVEQFYKLVRDRCTRLRETVCNASAEDNR